MTTKQSVKVRQVILFEPDQYERLKHLSRHYGVSVCEVVRRAVDDRIWAADESAVTTNNNQQGE